MKNDNSKTPYDSYLESFEKIRKSLIPLTKTLSEMIFDTSAFTGAAELMSGRIAEMVKEYENVRYIKICVSHLKAAYTPFKVSESINNQWNLLKRLEDSFQQ
ncbi:MAG: hypothetical protein V8S36_09500 [Lachnospiraceae bacterium]